MNEDLLKALLSMDSYNRGYNAGINTLSDDSGIKIANATIYTTSSDTFDVGVDTVASFYSIAYKTFKDADDSSKDKFTTAQ